MRKLLILLALSVLACKEDDSARNIDASTPVPDASTPSPVMLSDAATLLGNLGNQSGALDAGLPGSSVVASALPPAYMLVQTVDSPEGRQNYVIVSDKLSVGEFDTKQAREFSGTSRIFTIGGALFVADAETLSIRKFIIDADTKLVEAGEVSFTNYGITYFDTGFTFIDDQTAWYMASDVFKVIQFNPETMKITGDIELVSLKHPTLATYIDGGRKVGDYVFAAVWDYNDGYTVYGNAEVKVAIISTSAKKLVKVITDPRCVTAAVAAQLPNDDLLVMGNSQNGYNRLFGVPPVTQPNCLLRIKAGSTEFDPSFYKNLDEITAPNVDASSFQYVETLNKAIVSSRQPGTFATGEAFQTDAVWQPSLVDLDTWVNEPLLTDRLQGASVSIIDGKAYFTVARSDGKKGKALALLENGKLIETAFFTEDWAYAERIR